MYIDKPFLMGALFSQVVMILRSFTTDLLVIFLCVYLCLCIFTSGGGNGNPPQYSCLENSVDRSLQSMGSQEWDITEQLSTHMYICIVIVYIAKQTRFKSRQLKLSHLKSDHSLKTVTLNFCCLVISYCSVLLFLVDFSVWTYFFFFLFHFQITIMELQVRLVFR